MSNLFLSYFLYLCINMELLLSTIRMITLLLPDENQLGKVKN